MLQVADSFIEDAGLNEEDEEGRDEEIEVPWFVLFCPKGDNEINHHAKIVESIFPIHKYFK